MQIRWFHEGFASYIESFKRKRDDIALSLINTLRLRNIYEAVKNGKYVPLKDFIKTPAYFLSPMLAYAQSWSMVDFFHKYEDGKYKEKFLEYFKEVLPGGGDVNDFTRIFGDLDKIEEE